MAKTKYQESAMDYANEYLERLLDAENVVGRDFYKRLNKILEEKVQQTVKEFMHAEAKNTSDDDNHKP